MNRWDTVQLQNLEYFLTSGSRGWAQYYSEVGSLFLRITNLDRDTISIDLSNCKFVNLPDGTQEGRRTEVEYGDILISITADLGIIGYVDHSIPSKTYVNQHVALLRINDTRVYNKFLAYSLATDSSYHQFLRLNDAGAKAGLSLKTIRKLKIVLPPLEEQRKIAEILSAWDEAITLTERLIEAKQKRKKGLMQQLLTGKVRFPGFEGEEWDKRKLGDVAKFLDRQRKPIKKSDRAKMRGQYPYYGASGIIDYVNDYIFDDDLILLGEDGENILSRNLPLAFRVSGKVWVNNHAHVIKPKESMNIAFLTAYLESLSYERYNNGTAQPKITKSTCLKITIAVPSLAEQQKIGKVLSLADEEIDLLQRKAAALREQKKGLMQQLLTGKVRVKV